MLKAVICLSLAICLIFLSGCAASNQRQADQAPTTIDSNQKGDISDWNPISSNELNRAAFDANTQECKRLIEDGADVNAKDIFGLTPLHSVAGGMDKKYYREVVFVFSNAMVTYDVNAGVEIAELLIAKGANVNAKDKEGYTPLHWAATQGRKGVVEVLILNGADVNAKSKENIFKKGKTPMQMAVEQGQIFKDSAYVDIIVLLRQHGATE